MTDDPRIKVRSAAQGYQYRVYVDGETDSDGRLNPATAKRIVGGFAVSEEEAERKAREVLE